MKQMSKELSKLSSIEKIFSGIKLSVTSLENKVKTMESKLINCEKSCRFLSNEYADQTKEFNTAKRNVSKLQKRCTDLDSYIHLMLLLFLSSGVVCNHFSIFLSLDTFSILCWRLLVDRHSYLVV